MNNFSVISQKSVKSGQKSARHILQIDVTLHPNYYVHATKSLFAGRFLLKNITCTTATAFLADD